MPKPKNISLGSKLKLSTFGVCIIVVLSGVFKILFVNGINGIVLPCPVSGVGVAVPLTGSISILGLCKSGNNLALAFGQSLFENYHNH